MSTIRLRYLKSTFFSPGNALFIAQKSTKCNDNADNIIKLNKDNKQLFGNLIETQKQRRKRRKQEEVLSVPSECTSEIKMVRVRNTVSKDKILGTQNVNNVESQVQTNDSKVLINCESIFSKTVKNDQITNFPLINDARSDVNFEMPETGIIRLLRDDPHVKFYSAYPPVTKIISDTMSNYSRRLLEKWKERMLKTLGQEKFELMKKGFVSQSEIVLHPLKANLTTFCTEKTMCETCNNINETFEQKVKCQLDRGAEFHENVCRMLLGQGPKENITEVAAASMKSLDHIWPLINSTMVVESHVAHPQLGYRGVVDCVCKFRGTSVLIEWKLSEKLKPRLQHTYDAPIQLSAYLGALNYDNNFKFQVNHGLVVVAYTSGVPADAFFLRPKVCEHYWKLWLNRLKTYNKLHKNDLLLEETHTSLDFF